MNETSNSNHYRKKSNIEHKTDAESGELTESDDSGEIVEPEKEVTLFPDVKPKKLAPISEQGSLINEPLRELPEWLAAKRRIPCKYFK